MFNFRLNIFLSFYHWVVVFFTFPEEGVFEFMNWIILGFIFGEVVEIELSEEWAIIIMSEILWQKSAAKFIWLVDCESFLRRWPAYEVLVIGVG